MNRRAFLRRGATLGAGAVALEAFPYHLFASESKKLASDRILLGADEGGGQPAGAGQRHQRRGRQFQPDPQAGVKGLADLFHAAYDQGVTFWDSADQYGPIPT